ncbi:MAG: UDP-N-acetylmuramate--L-alanine ligase [bacterium]
MTLPERLHLIGIGGTGMSALAFLLKESGFQVSGSDPLLEDHLQRKMEDAGITVFTFHHPENIQGAQGVVVSSAIPDENVELQAALQADLPIMHRVDALLKLTPGKRRIAVAGTHGKGTTTAMIGYILKEFGLSPTFYNGAEIINYQKRSFLGEGRHFVLETDESDGSFLKTQPDCAVITNVSSDHLNFWGDFEALKEGFRKFAQSASEHVVLSEEAQETLNLKGGNLTSYGISNKANFRLLEALQEDEGLRIAFLFQGNKFEFCLPMLGEHNAWNALGAIAISFLEGVPIEASLETLSRFKGIKRRLEKKGIKGSIVIYDDYAHHPTEIRRALEALRLLGRRIVCVFQPHRYSRVKALQKLYGKAFEPADLIFVLPIFSAGEKIDYGLSGEEVKEAISFAFPEKFVRFLPKEAVFEELRKVLRSDDLVVFMGPGDIDRLSERAMDEING